MLSNKSLAFILIASIFLSLVGTLTTLNKINNGVTGLATGRVNLSVTAGAECQVMTNISFGDSGAMDDDSYILSTNRSHSANGFSKNCLTDITCSGLVINNTGNVDLNVTLNSSAAAVAFLGGPQAVSADFQYQIHNGTGDLSNFEPGCAQNGSATIWYNNWADVSTSATLICANLTALPNNQLITAEFNVTVRKTTPGGTKSATIGISCAQI